MRDQAELAVYESYEDVFGTRSSLNELIADISSFSRESVLWACAFVATGMQLWNQPASNPSDIFDLLLAHFFQGALKNRLAAGYWSSNPRRYLFHRRQILLISKLAILHCSGRGMNAWTQGHNFGIVFLKASDQFHYDLLPHSSQARATEKEDFARIITEMVAVGEHAPPHVFRTITRSHLMLTRFLHLCRNDPDFVDVASEHEKATGLSLAEVEAMIIGTHARFGEGLSRTIFKEPGALPLKDRNFAATSISSAKVIAFIDMLSANLGEMYGEIVTRDNGPNDFTAFRKFPLLQMYFNMHLRTAWTGFLMMDNVFFLEKIRTNPYWLANAAHGAKLHRFWGRVFEKYVNELLGRACAGSNALFIPDPRLATSRNDQICDGMLVAGDSLVLLEYKSSMFRADNKYSGDFSSLADEIEKKLVYDTEAGRKKGVWQLAEAVQQLFNRGEHAVPINVDLGRVKRVYLYIVTLDSIGSTIGMSPFLNEFLSTKLNTAAFPFQEIRPLFCSDIEALESITGLFAVRTLPELLESWYQTNPSLTTPLSAIDFGNLPWRTNEWLQDEWTSIYKTVITILFPDKNPDIAVQEAIALARRMESVSTHIP